MHRNAWLGQLKEILLPLLPPPEVQVDAVILSMAENQLRAAKPRPGVVFQ